MSSKITFTLDGKQVETAEGTLVLDAAKAAGIEIPHYCYHPALGNPGVCRLCMVQVEGMAKLQVSCRLMVKQGMVVRSNSPEARKAQASSLEFHLVNHPLDCPVCDQAGECWLQDYYMRYGRYTSSLRENKPHKPKRLDIGQNIMLDSERCILCTRCTRFLDQVTGTHELGIFQRGNRSELLPYPGRRVDNPYAGNIVDICPVGALTDKDFRFQVRVWYLDRTPSICVGCSRGCSIEIHTNTKRPWHSQGRRVLRLKPRFNPEVNGWWICDEGRYSYKSVDAKTRLKTVSLLEQGQLRPRTWPEACAKLAGELKEHCAKLGSQGLGVILSGSLSNEDFYVARRLFSEHLRAGYILLRPEPDQIGEEDSLLRRRDKVPNLRGGQALGFGSKIAESSWEDIAQALKRGELWGLYVVDRDPFAIWGPELQRKVLELPLSVYQGSQVNGFAHAARWVLPAASWAEEEGTYCNFQGQVQRSHAAVPALGESMPDWAIWRDMLKSLGVDCPYENAAAIFQQICLEPEFETLSWEGLGAEGQALRASSAPAKASA